VVSSRSFDRLTPTPDNKSLHWALSMTACGRKRPFILAVFEVSERPVRRKADVQIVIQNNRLVNGWIKSPGNQYGPQLGPPVYFSGPANSDNIALRPDLATSD